MVCIKCDLIFVNHRPLDAVVAFSRVVKSFKADHESSIADVRLVKINIIFIVN